MWPHLQYQLLAVVALSAATLIKITVLVIAGATLEYSEGIRS
jgi:hypothetical protein